MKNHAVFWRLAASHACDRFLPFQRSETLDEFGGSSLALAGIQFGHNRPRVMKFRQRRKDHADDIEWDMLALQDCTNSRRSVVVQARPIGSSYGKNSS